MDKFAHYRSRVSAGRFLPTPQAHRCAFQNQVTTSRLGWYGVAHYRSHSSVIAAQLEQFFVCLVILADTGTFRDRSFRARNLRVAREKNRNGHDPIPYLQQHYSRHVVDYQLIEWSNNLQPTTSE